MSSRGSTAVSPEFCANHENVSSVFSLAYCTLEKQLSTQENGMALVSAGCNGTEP